MISLNKEQIKRSLFDYVASLVSIPLIPLVYRPLDIPLCAVLMDQHFLFVLSRIFDKYTLLRIIQPPSLIDDISCLGEPIIYPWKIRVMPPVRV